MNDEANIKPTTRDGTLHFQILVAGTVIFLGALFWLTHLDEDSGGNVNMDLLSRQVHTSIKALACFVAFVSVVLGHKVLR